MYDFDRILDRKGSDSIKWDFIPKSSNGEELLPMWVADMDIQTPQFVFDEISRISSHGVLGYTGTTSRWAPAIVSWFSRRHGAVVNDDELLFIPGIVRGIAFAELCFTVAGDKVMVMSPVYHPFFLVTEKLGRQVVRCPLSLNEEKKQYDLDFALFTRLISGCKMLVLSNPHNPGGKVWSKDELSRIATIARQNGCLVISDEIHADLTCKSYTHNTLFSVSEDAASNCIVFGSPSKAFNMPGLCSSYAIIKNPCILERFKSFMDAGEFDFGNIFSAACCAACYEKGDEWLDEVLEYIHGNILYVKDFLNNHIPQISMLDIQASYLAFLDCRKLGLSQNDLVSLFIDKAGLFLNDGSMFGPEGVGFMRMNLGCPRSVLEKALMALKSAVDSIS